MDSKKRDKSKPLTEQSEKPKLLNPEMDERYIKLMMFDGPDSEAPYTKSQDASIEPQNEAQDSLSSKQPKNKVKKEEEWELEICFRGNPGMIITRKRTDKTRRLKGRLR